MDEPGTRPAGEETLPDEGRKGPRSSLGIIFLTLFLDLAGFSIIFPLSPSLLEHYLKLEGSGGLLGGLVRAIESASPLAAKDPIYAAALFGGVLGSVYSLLQFLFSPVWGSLSDRIGRKPVLLISIAGIALSYAGWAFSGSFLLFVAARFLAGAMGGNISVATAAAADVTSRQDRAKAMGIVGAAFGLGFICGPAIGGGLAHVDLPARLPSLVPWGLNPFSAAALGAFALALGNLLWVAARFQETLPAERRGAAGPRRPLNPLSFFRKFEQPGIRRTNVVWFIYLLAFSGMEFTLTFLAHERFDYGPWDNAKLFLFVGAIMVVVQGGVVRRVAPRFGERRVAAAGLLLALPGFALMGMAPRPWVLYAGLGLMGMGNGLASPSITSLVSLYASPERQGAVLGVFRSLGAFSRILGPVIATLVFWELGSGSPYYLGALVLVPPLAMVFGLPEPRKH